MYTCVFTYKIFYTLLRTPPGLLSFSVARFEFKFFFEFRFQGFKSLI